jgi:hypothetical protein
MNKKVIIGIGVAATLVAAYFIFKPKKKDEVVSNQDPFEPTPNPRFPCKLPELPCPNNKLKCFNPLIFGQNQCGNVLS